VQLSNDLQLQLDNLNSKVQLATIIDGTFPTEYAFIGGDGRQFRTEFASNRTEFSVVLFERTPNLNYENCFARAVIRDLNKLARLIDLWVDKHTDIEKLSCEFSELELFKPFSFIHDNPAIEAAWIKVKNMKFNTPVFWKDTDWNDRYEIMLEAAKRHKGFATYFPFTSHYWLRFSIDKDIKETWTLDTYMIPTMYSIEVPKTLGKFYVSFNDKPIGGQFFATVKDGLDFYAEKLIETKPIKWTTH